jgi:hypothetical protein
LSAKEQVAAMASTVQRAVTLLQWQQQGAAGTSSEATLDAELQGCLSRLQLQALTLPVECLLLAPSADMASSGLQLMTLLAEQADAAERTAVDDALVDDAVSMALQQLGPAVYHAARHTGSLKQRRQLMRLWSDALKALLPLQQGRC